MASGSAGSKKNRKVGRNAIWCKHYALTHKRERNKVKKINRHLKKFPDDLVAQNALKLLAAFV